MLADILERAPRGDSSCLTDIPQLKCPASTMKYFFFTVGWTVESVPLNSKKLHISFYGALGPFINLLENFNTSTYLVANCIRV